MPRHGAQPLLLPRGLIFLASLWLIGSWLLTIGVRVPIQPVSASYTPSVVMMLLSTVVGLMIGWPLLRLSQRPAPRPIVTTILDLVVLGALVQVVLWPLRLVTPWSVMRTAAIDAVLVSWLLIAGAVVASAVGASRSGVRSLAMLACLAMCLLGPALAAVGAASGFDNALDLIGLSPLMAVRTLGEGGGGLLTTMQWRWILLLAVAALLTWTALAAVALIGRMRSDMDPGGSG